MAPKTLACIGALLCAAAARPAPGQASYVERFDDNGEVVGCQAGPANLIARGWSFSRQSGTSFCWAFTDGDPDYYPPQDGPGYLNAYGFDGGPISNWAIVPPVADQVAGDPITIWLFGSFANGEVHFEVRYSPTGGTSTGSGAFAVGDFTQVLLDVSPLPQGWQMYQATVPDPGNGRLALRLRGSVSGFSMIAGIDTLAVGPPPPLCPGFPPIPAPGQTVTWTAAGGPYRLCADLIIPETSTVVVEPGAVVEIDPERRLVVNGTLRAEGAPGSPVTFNTTGFAGRIVSNGHTELNWTTLNCPLEYPSGGTTIILRDCVINAAGSGALGYRTYASYVWDKPPTIVVERCQVTGDGVQDALYFYLDHCHGLVRDVTLTGVTAAMDGYVFLDGIVSTGAPQDGISVGENVRNLYLNNASITNAAEAALDLTLAHHAFVGADNVLQGCRYAVKANSLLPGTVVPPTGNTFNHVAAEGGAAIGRKLWSNVGVPWGWNNVNYAVGPVTIAPGVTVLMYPDMFMVSEHRVSAEGLPGSPITFTPLDPARPWLQVIELVSEGSRYDHCILEGAADDALVVADTIVHVDNTIFRNNAVGLTVGENGAPQVRKTRFTNNGLGVYASDDGFLFLSAPDAPSVIAGNGQGMFAERPFLGVYDAKDVWWGHPTGPAAPHNPGGQGDVIAGLGASFVEIFPFLTGPPDFGNHPPVVRIPNEPGLLEPGSKVIIRWTAEDDDQIVSQRILFSEWLNGDTLFEVVADNLPPDQRSFEFTVPDVPVLPTPSYVRIQAIDSHGQIGWDEFPTLIPAGDLDVDTTITSDFGGLTIRGGEDLPSDLTWIPINNPPGLRADFSIQLDADEQAAGLGGWFADRGVWNVTQTPFVSTDLARVAIVVRDNLNDSETFFGEYFSIRPDALLGDAPPVVQLLSPSGGSFPGGGVVPVSWTASDDESVRSIQIQASYDGGRTWHTVVRDLPGSEASFDWELPASSGIPDVRVRVIARDLRFQSSSSTGEPFVITAGGPCRADLDGSGTLTLNDFVVFRNLYVAGDLRADFDGDGVLALNDFVAFRNGYVGGCP